MKRTKLLVLLKCCGDRTSALLFCTSQQPIRGFPPPPPPNNNNHNHNKFKIITVLYKGLRTLPDTLVFSYLHTHPSCVPNNMLCSHTHITKTRTVVHTQHWSLTCEYGTHLHNDHTHIPPTPSHTCIPVDGLGFAAVVAPAPTLAVFCGQVNQCCNDHIRKQWCCNGHIRKQWCCNGHIRKQWRHNCSI